MVALLLRKLLRDMRRSLASYLTVALVAGVGLAGYTVLSNATNQLEQSKQFFFAQTAFCDGFAEVREAPLSVAGELERIEGVQRAQGRLVREVQVAGMERQTQLKLISIVPDGPNLPLLSRGMQPTPDARELVLGENFCKENGMLPGDAVLLSVGGEEHAFLVSGSGLSPENIYLVRSLRELLPTPATYDAAFVDYGAMSRLLGLMGKANNFAIDLAPGVAFAEVQERIEAVLAPYGCIRAYGSADELSVSVLEMEIEQIGKVSKVIPFLFLGIAAIILAITLHRLIEQQRTQIGTMMALGLSKDAIRLHYVAGGAVVGLVGGLGGGIYGSLAAGPMADFYRVYFSLPKVDVPISLGALGIGTLGAVLFCAGVALLSVRQAFTLVPAEALRPAPPKKARRLFLESIPGFSRLLTVPGLMAARSLARSPRRSLLSLFGIACAYMITATLVSMNTMFDVYLFDDLEKTQRQDISIGFEQPVARQDARRMVRGVPIERIEGMVEFALKLRGPLDELDASVQAIEQDSRLCRLYDERGAPVFVQPEGIVLSIHMADRLGVGVGDAVEAELVYPEKAVTRLTVSGIVAQYMGGSCYMSLEGAGKISEYRGVYTTLLLRAPDEARAELVERLRDSARTVVVQDRRERVAQYHGMMGSISGVMASMAVMGVLIGFAVIYVSTLISFEELKREIAVLRMLGLTDRACLQTVSFGQWLLTLGALLPGGLMAAGMSRLISRTMSLELFSIPDFVDGGSLLLSAGLMLVAAGLSSMAVHRKLKKTTAVELMRERE